VLATIAKLDIETRLVAVQVQVAERQGATYGAFVAGLAEDLGLSGPTLTQFLADAERRFAGLSSSAAAAPL
jgi:hypothetical protein